MSPSGEPGSRPSVAIAGGGLVGLSIAWRLAQRGFRVAVFEKAAAGAEASWAGAGMLAPGGELESPSSHTGLGHGQTPADLFIKSRHLYAGFIRELERATQIAIDYQECGALELAYTGAEWDDLQARAERRASLGVSSKVLSPRQIATFWPRVRARDLSGAVFYPGDAIVNPRELIVALLAACRGLGVEVFEHSPVESAELADADVRIKTGRGEQSFQALVIAAGAWSDSIQVRNVERLPRSEPVKGHLVGYQQPDQTCITILRHGDTYLLQRANGLLIAGASVEHVGWHRSIDPEIVRLLTDRAAFVLPHLAETSPTEIWTGFRPASDELHIGAWGSKRLYLAYGHYRNGILLAPLTAEEICRELTANLRTQ